MVQAKKVTNRRKFDDELKNEIIRMLNSGRNVKEISQAFEIAENVLYRWKTEQNMKQKTMRIKMIILCELLLKMNSLKRIIYE